MISKLKGIVLAVIVLLASIMMPFNVYADNITSSNINGISVSLDEVTNLGEKAFTVDGNLINVDQNYYLYTAEIQFDKSYIGNININIQYTYQARNDTGIVTYNGTKVQKVFVNGDKAYMSFGFIAYSNLDPLWYNSITYSLTNSDVIEYGLISDVQQIINILLENQDIIDNILTELQKVVTNTSLTNDYLENIDNLIDTISWKNISSNIGYRADLSDTITSWTGNVGAFNGYLTFSYTNLRTFDNLYRIYLPVLYKGSLSDIRLFFDNGTDVTDEYLLYITRSRIGLVLYLISDSYKGFYGNGNINIKGNYSYVYAPNSSSGKASLMYLSSDDIEYWQLKSFFINDKYLSIIANGTTASENAAGQLESATTDFDTSSEQLITFEDSMNDDMNDKLDVIDTTTGLNIFGQNFLTSAEWVRIQFNHLTTNTPYGSMVVYGLTLGLALLLLGKVFL